VIVYLDGQRAYLSLVPSVDLCLNRERMLVPKHCQSSSFPMDKLLKDGRFNQRKFAIAVADGWQGAKRSSPNKEDMVEVALFNRGASPMETSLSRRA
jgi:hypothetical protein